MKMPEAGIHSDVSAKGWMDSRLRGNDGEK
jgi:hypothetical protein